MRQTVLGRSRTWRQSSSVYLSGIAAAEASVAVKVIASAQLKLRRKSPVGRPGPKPLSSSCPGVMVILEACAQSKKPRLGGGVRR
jgi:hypothetical protein